MTPNDRADYYAIQLSGGESVGLVLDGLAASGANELFVSFGAIPTRTSFDFRAVKDERFQPRAIGPIRVAFPDPTKLNRAPVGHGDIPGLGRAAFKDEQSVVFDRQHATDRAIPPAQRAGHDVRAAQRGAVQRQVRDGTARLKVRQ